MCGFVAISTAENTSVSSHLLERMTETLVHRGPDDFGYAWIRPADSQCRRWTSQPPCGDGMSGVLFGHRRLSILDLSAASHQPFANTDSSIVIVYNGEIYNHVELRNELAAEGTQFRSRGDTEVLLAAYERWGEAAFNRFNGMWAFVLWDGRARKLVIARDRFGVKPLYYTLIDGTWIFASEIKALREYPGAKKGIHDGLVMEFLLHAATDHGEETMFTAIRSVPPGGYLVLQNGRATDHRFWTLPPNPAPAPRVETELVEEFRSLLADSVRIRMRCDVPIGTMLSGGLDSTSITALIDLHRRSDGPAPDGQPSDWGSFQHTFTACWPDTPHLDEEATVRRLCRRWQLQSHRLYPTAEEVRDLLPRVTTHLEQPFGTPVAAVQFILMRAARSQGVKVLLNGHGSDELLGGYHEVVVPAYLASLLLRGQVRQYRHERERFGLDHPRMRAMLARELLRGLCPLTMRSSLINRLGKMRRGLGIFQADWKTSFQRDAVLLSTLRRLPTFDAVLWLSVTEHLPRWLRMEDRMSLAHSVESRLPFMDYRLIEFAFRLPQALKIHDGYTKFILREAMKPTLPETIVSERQKRRFTVPLAEWFRGPWRNMVGDLLLSRTPKAAPYLDLPKFRRQVDRYLRGGDSNGLDAFVLWRILHTEIWLREFA